MTDAPAATSVTTPTAAQPTATPAPAATSQPSPAQTTTTTAPEAKPAPADPAQLLFEEAKPAETAEGAEKPKDETKPEDAAPEAVKLEEMTLPEDMAIPEDMKGPLGEFFTEHKFSKEQGQKVVDLGVKMQQHNIDLWNKTKQDWRKEVEADPTIGGNNLKQTVGQVNDVIRKFAGTEENLAELKQDLVLLGLGNKRSFIRLMSNIAKATGNDSAAASAGGTQLDGIDAMAKRMYPNMA